MYHELNKMYLCARITLELYECIVTLCPTKNAVTGYPTGTNQEHEKYTAESFAKIYVIFPDVLVNTTVRSSNGYWVNLQIAMHKIKTSILQTKRYVVVSLTQTCNLFFFVSVREEQDELGVEIITLSFRPASYCVEGKHSLQRGRTKRHFLQKRRWHNQFKFFFF